MNQQQQQSNQNNNNNNNNNDNNNHLSPSNQSNLLIDENDERYGFSSSSTDSSEESSSLLLPQHQNQSNHSHRILLKRRKKISANNRSSCSDDSRSCASRPTSPPISNHPHPTTAPYWPQSIIPSSPPIPLHHYHHHHHHLYHIQHHQHLLPKEQQPHPIVPSQPTPNKIPPFINIPRSNSDHSSSTTCLDSLDSNINPSSLSPSLTSNGSPEHHLQLSHDLVSLPQPEFFHSHHLSTSTHPHSKSSYLYSTPHHYRPIADPSRLSSPPELAIGLDLPSHPPKRSWFSSRRSKRKHSIHALSVTSSSSTTSLRLSPPPIDPYYSKYFDSLLPKHPLSSSAPSSRRSSVNQLKRWMRSSSSGSSLSVRWLKKSLRPRLPLGILLGLLLFISFAVSLTVFLIHYLDTDKEPLPWRTYCQEQREFPHQLADSLEPVNVFVGVFSIDSAYERRHLIRSTYARHSRPIDPLTGQISHNVQLKFILGKPRIQHVRRIALEMETYNDVVVLDIQENMNRGKTYAFLSWASENATVPVYYHPLHEPKPKTGINGIGGVMYPDRMETVNVGVGFKKADFVVKADDDAFIVLSELERHLRVAPRTMTYWGYLIRNLFMGGECYALSADLVNYVAKSEKVLDHLTGAEDKKVAKWMRIHPNATEINWVTERCWIYDHPKAGTTYSHGFLFPDQVQRIRDEGKFGLSEDEIELRGPGRTQSYSSVVRWKERYVAPKSLMTMEEEVEALVEGGGRFSKTDWKRPMEKDNLISAEKVLFDPDDHRLLKSSIIGGPASLKSSVPLPGEFTPPVQGHYQEPSLKFGRPPNELMAEMPPMKDLPESLLKDKLREGLAGKTTEESLASDQKISLNNEKSTSVGEKVNHDDDESKQKQKQVQFVPHPTLRFDPEEMRIRNERFLNLPYGGTVVVHYLKRNEWFLETSLILLGRAKTWDDGLIPAVYEPSHQIRSATRKGDNDHYPFKSTIEPDGNSVVVSSSTSSSDQPKQKTSNALSTIDRSLSSANNHDHSNQKKIQVSDLGDWGKFDQVEEINVGGMFGGARMYGSPVIENDGTISEGRRRTTMKSRPGSSSSTLASRGKEPNNSNNSIKSKNNDVPDVTLGNNESGSGAVAHGNQMHPGRHQLEEKDDDDDDPKVNDIRKTQFGGAGWIRGKPRLRVADQLDGPHFGHHQSVLSPPGPSVDQYDLHQDEEESQPLIGYIRDEKKTGLSVAAEPQEPIESINNNPSSPLTTGNSQAHSVVGNEEEEEEEEEEFKFEYGSDSSLILGQHQHESFDIPHHLITP